LHEFFPAVRIDSTLTISFTSFLLKESADFGSNFISINAAWFKSFRYSRRLLTIGDVILSLNSSTKLPANFDLIKNGIDAQHSYSSLSLKPAQTNEKRNA
jgi:hypothetical protein